MTGGKVIDLTGKQFGRLTILRRAANKNYHARWECSCACGGSTISTGTDLRLGRFNG